MKRAQRTVKHMLLSVHRDVANHYTQRACVDDLLLKAFVDCFLCIQWKVKEMKRLYD